MTCVDTGGEVVGHLVTMARFGGHAKTFFRVPAVGTIFKNKQAKIINQPLEVYLIHDYNRHILFLFV